jgi:hypothetical protein
MKSTRSEVFGIAAHNEEIPLHARMEPHALVYFEDPYFVCRVRAGGPDEQWCSVLTLQNTFGFGTYHWKAKASNPGRYEHHWLGGFERHHGFSNEGIIGFWIVDGSYKVLTCWDGKCEDTSLLEENWTSESEFSINWTPKKIEYLVGQRLIATHVNTVPQGRMNFFFEAGRIGGITSTDHSVFLRRNSFTH